MNVVTYMNDATPPPEAAEGARLERVHELVSAYGVVHERMVIAEARVRSLEAALGERIEMACRKGCGWSRRIVGGAIEHTPIHSHQCEQARALLAPPA